MTRRWLRAAPVLWIGVWALPAASVPAGAAALTWSVVPSPCPGTRDMLNGVSCASAATCTAAGSNARNSQSPPETLIETGR